jgi:hypothetical protein
MVRVPYCLHSLLDGERFRVEDYGKKSLNVEHRFTGIRIV